MQSVAESIINIIIDLTTFILFAAFIKPRFIKYTQALHGRVDLNSLGSDVLTRHKKSLLLVNGRICSREIF
jgi:hypothetical protein